jgi:transcriptional regulator GlxA family with amidase domain
MRALPRRKRGCHDNFQRTFRFEDVAGRMGMSLRTFARRFKAATADSPLGYLQKLRVAMGRPRLNL